MRELENTLHIKGPNLRLLEEIEASVDSGNEFISVYVLDKINSIPNPNHEEIETGYFYSDNELDWLIREFRELIAPGLVFLDDIGLLFRTR